MREEQLGLLLSKPPRPFTNSPWEKGDRATVKHLDYPDWWHKKSHKGTKLPFVPNVTVGKTYDVYGFDMIEGYVGGEYCGCSVLLVALLGDDGEIGLYEQSRLEHVPL